MRSSRSCLVSALVTIGAFGSFVLVRLLAWRYRYVIYGDAYAYYVPAGVYYVRGGLPQLGVWQTNPEHPPLANYIIGFFAVYFQDGWRQLRLECRVQVAWWMVLAGWSLLAVYCIFMSVVSMML